MPPEDNPADDEVRSDPASAEMPKYKCHKEVWALRIARVIMGDDGCGLLQFEEGQFAGIEMVPEWMNKHIPQVGGYYVVYDDGYKSYSPAKAFEEGYTRI